MLVNGARLKTDPAGALYWPAHGVLMVADLHLEKGSSFAARGQLLPPHDTLATLRKLERLIDAYQPRHVVCLGDSFHDREASRRLASPDRALLTALATGREWTWIAGNHDPVPPDAAGDVTDELVLDGLTLRHEPQTRAVPGEIAGHLHPKAKVNVRGRQVSRRCFVTDGRRAVLPSFGAYTGGLDVLSAPFQALFAGDFEAHLLGRDDVHVITSRRLNRGRRAGSNPRAARSGSRV
jgi:DNA ligase-associated metallophosphoesterase